jgi:hypothetical protein
VSVRRGAIAFVILAIKETAMFRGTFCYLISTLYTESRLFPSGLLEDFGPKLREVSPSTNSDWSWPCGHYVMLEDVVSSNSNAIHPELGCHTLRKRNKQRELTT